VTHFQSDSSNQDGLVDNEEAFGVTIVTASFERISKSVVYFEDKKELEAGFRSCTEK